MVISLALTIKSDNSIELVFIVLSLSLAGQCLYGEGRVSGEGAQAREKVDGKVGASRLGLLREGKTNGRTQDGPGRVYRGQTIILSQQLHEHAGTA